MRKFSDYDIPNHILCWIPKFLLDRRQRSWVKLAQDWLALHTINDLNSREADMWKYVVDTIISDVVNKGQESCIQQVVDDLVRQARDARFQLNDRKCKGLRISFALKEPEFDSICVNRQTLVV